MGHRDISSAVGPKEARLGCRRRGWTFLILLVVCLFLATCANPDSVNARRAVLAQMLATSAQIFVEGQDGLRRAGSGVVLSTDLPHGRAAILTTAHLLKPPIQQSALIIAGVQSEQIPAEIVAIDFGSDLALMTAPLRGVSPAALASHAELSDEIFVIAYPWGRQRTVVRGAISQIATRPSVEDPFSISGPVALVDATVSYGMSGGGVFDKRTGQLVGLVRGYRTAELSLPSEGTPLRLPIAGETTVISTRDILCFLRSSGYEGLVARSTAATTTERDCQQLG